MLTENLNYKFKLPICDWSSDGHGRCDYFLILSNRPLNELREIYFATNKKVNLYGLDGEYSPCSDYADNEISSEQIESLGLHPEDYDKFIEKYAGITQFSPKGFAQLFVDYIMLHNPQVVLEIVQEEPVEMFPFYGFDEQNRHIGHFGYGLYLE